MTKFEDRLFGQLMSEHGHKLRAVARPSPARHRVRRPVWLATGAVGTAAAATAAALALSAAPAMAAYSVSQHNGTTSVSVYNESGVAGANGALHKMHARVVVVPVRPGCPPMGSLPHPHLSPHPSVSVASGWRDGHRYVSVKIKGSIPRGVTMILAFVGDGGKGHTQGGAGGFITGPVPSCVSLNLPSPAHGTGGTSA